MRMRDKTHKTQKPKPLKSVFDENNQLVIRLGREVTSIPCSYIYDKINQMPKLSGTKFRGTETDTDLETGSHWDMGTKFTNYL